MLLSWVFVLISSAKEVVFLPFRGWFVCQQYLTKVSHECLRNFYEGHAMRQETTD